MKYTENEHAYILGLRPHPPVIAGFTKTALKGDVVNDITKALAFTGRTLEVSHMKQLHGSTVRLVEKPGLYECDGLFTKSDNLTLVVRTADCMPLIFYSEKENTIGVLHVGWRSAKEGILDRIEFNLPSFLCVAGVGIRKCCYRVGEEFLGYRLFRPFIEYKSGSYYFDSVNFIKEKLIERGLSEKRFFDTGICSYCSEYGFYSYRRTAASNRTLSFIAKYRQ